MLCAGVQAKPLNIETSSYVLNPETNTYLYRNAKVTWENITLEGTEIRMDPERKTAVAEGYVRFKQDQMLIVMDRLEVDLEQNTGVFYNTILFDASNRAFMTASEVRWLGRNHFVGQSCSFTTCNPKNPAWEIRGGEIHYRGQNFSSSESTVLSVRGVPVFYFPYLAWPTVTRRQSGFLAPGIKAVRSSVPKFDLGYRIGIPYFWAIDPEHDLTLMYEWVEHRGPGLHAEYQYAFRQGVFGELRIQRFFERDPRDPQNESGSLNAETIGSDELHPARFKLSFNHNHQIDESSRLIANGLSYSDSQFEREYEQVREPELYAQKLSVSINRQFSSGSVSLSVARDWKFNEIAILNRGTDHETREQKIPALSYSFSNRLWGRDGHTLTGMISGTLVRHYRRQGWNGIGAGAIPRLKYRFSLFSLINGSVGIGRQLTDYRVWDTTAAGSEDRYGFAINETEAEINTTLSRQFQRESGIISRLKHLVTPRLLYEFIDDVPQQSASGTPFGGEVNTRRLATFRLDNVILAKRRLFTKPLTLTGHTLIRLQRAKLDPKLIARLEPLKNRVFSSQKEMVDALDRLPGEALKSREMELILNYAEQGVRLPTSGLTVRPVREGKSWVLARLDFIQTYDFLKRDPLFQPEGPAVKGDETEAGQPLLPLRTNLILNPGPRFSLKYFNRYHHQKQRVVEYSTDVSVGVSPYNKASVSFRNNETKYETPYGKTVDAGSTFGFGQTFEASDRLAFSYAGTIDLDADSTEFRRRLSSATLEMDYRPDCWAINLRLETMRDKTVTSGGEQLEYVDRTVFLNIKLGGVPLPEQPFRDLE